MQVSEWNWFRVYPYISESFRSIMNECEICFRNTDLFIVKVQMFPSDYDSSLFSPNWCLKFIPNDSAPIRTKFSYRLNPLNGANSFRMIPCHSALIANDSVAYSNGLGSKWFGNTFRIHTESFSFRMSPKLDPKLNQKRVNLKKLKCLQFLRFYFFFSKFCLF